jgi:hypothetical protein
MAKAREMVQREAGRAYFTASVMSVFVLPELRTLLFPGRAQRKGEDITRYVVFPSII